MFSCSGDTKIGEKGFPDEIKAPLKKIFCSYGLPLSCFCLSHSITHPHTRTHTRKHTGVRTSARLLKRLHELKIETPFQSVADTPLALAVRTSAPDDMTSFVLERRASRDSGGSGENTPRGGQTPGSAKSTGSGSALSTPVMKARMIGKGTPQRTSSSVDEMQSLAI